MFVSGFTSSDFKMFLKNLSSESTLKKERLVRHHNVDGTRSFSLLDSNFTGYVLQVCD